MTLLVIFLLCLALLATVLLGTGAAGERADLLEQINQLLPQTQCGECGYPGCRPYAGAIASGKADINRCPPGGDTTLQNLARLTGQPVKPLAPDLTPAAEQVAIIDETICIGCVKCIQACPVDAIIGAPKMMHTVIETECTGCRLCLAPCPVDCIDMVKAPVNLRDWHWAKPVIHYGD